MKIKKMLSALLAAAMMCSLLCLPAFAAGKDDALKDLNSGSLWMDVKDIDSLRDVVTVKMRAWDYDENTASWTLGDASEEGNYRVTKLPLGVTLTAGPNNTTAVAAVVYTADKDGVYVERLERVTDKGGYYEHDTMPLDSTGALKETDTVAYYWWFDWGWGTDNLLYSEYSGYRSLTTDYLVEEFGANTLLAFLGEDGELGDTLFLLTGEERPESLAFDSLSDYGIYFSKSGDMVSQWAVEPVNAAYDADLIPYYVEEAHNFDLTGKITRAEFASIAVWLYWELSGKDSVMAGEIPFTDVAKDSVYYENIRIAYELKIVTGKTDTLFRPDALVTRQEAATMLSRVYEAIGGKIPAVTATTFADNADIQNYARNAVAFMAEHEIINGVGSNRFNPTGDASVEQALKIAVEMLNKLGK